MSIETAFQKIPVLEAERLVLRQIHLADANALYQILSNPSVTEFYDDDPFTDITQAQEQIESWQIGFERRWALRWGIALKRGDDLIGTCGLYGFHPLHLRAGVGYELAQAHWRQGIMTEALSAVFQYSFDEIELNRIQALVMPGNTASIKLLEKLGFTNEGLLAQYENWGSKGFVDLYMFGLINPLSR
jgi:ribosomal-protein-alanine N-acetyltransferase